MNKIFIWAPKIKKKMLRARFEFANHLALLVGVWINSFRSNATIRFFRRERNGAHHGTVQVRHNHEPRTLRGSPRRNILSRPLLRLRCRPGTHQCVRRPRIPGVLCRKPGEGRPSLCGQKEKRPPGTHSAPNWTPFSPACAQFCGEERRGYQGCMCERRHGAICLRERENSYRRSKHLLLCRLRPCGDRWASSPAYLPNTRPYIPDHTCLGRYLPRHLGST